MISKASEFTFEPPHELSRARRVLIKPSAAYASPHPVTTRRELLDNIISGIRRVSDADILILEGNPKGEPMQPVYRDLGYEFPRVLTLDVKDCIFVEVENPLPSSFAVSSFWLPNVLLGCDYLITVAPFKICDKQGSLSIKNLLSLLPITKYGGEAQIGWSSLYSLGIHKVIADLYFTIPFDLGIIDAAKKLICTGEPTQGEIEEYDRVFVGEPYEVDCEASQASGIRTEYLELIEKAKAQFQT